MFSDHYTHLVVTVLVLLVFLWGLPLQKSLRLRRFKSDRVKFIRIFPHIKYASIGGVGFTISRHPFNMAAMTSFHTEKCCHLATEHTDSV